MTHPPLSSLPLRLLQAHTATKNGSMHQHTTLTSLLALREEGAWSGDPLRICLRFLTGGGEGEGEREADSTLDEKLEECEGEEACRLPLPLASWRL